MPDSCPLSAAQRLRCLAHGLPHPAIFLSLCLTAVLAAAAQCAELAKIRYNPDAGVLAPVQIGEERVIGWLDTGCSQTVFDWSLRRQMGQKMGEIRANTTTAAIAANQFAAPRATVAKLPIGDDPVLCLGIPEVKAVAGCELQAFIGMTFLKHKILQLDPDRGVVRLLDALPPDLGEPFALGVSPQAIPTITMQLPGGGEEQFLIDTGLLTYNSGDLSESVLRTLRARRQVIDLGRGLRTDAHGTSVLQKVEITSLKLGPFQHRHLHFSSSTRSTIGLRFLSRYVATFDFPGQTLYLRKSRTFDEEDRLDRSGMHFLRRNGEVEIVQVDAESPAENQGLQPGDIITHIDGEPAPIGALHPLRMRLTQVEHAVDLSVRRGQQQRAIHLDLNFVPPRPPQNPTKFLPQ